MGEGRELGTQEQAPSAEASGGDCEGKTSKSRYIRYSELKDQNCCISVLLLLGEGRESWAPKSRSRLRKLLGVTVCDGKMGREMMVN